jgi:hypothetical protein
MRPGLKAIETVYQGYRFRSRLEARWAVFFDAFHAPWEYEKEGFDINGVWYLPDFWLPTLGVYAEVKPDMLDQHAYALAEACECLVLDGVPAIRLYHHAGFGRGEDGFYHYPGYPEECVVNGYDQYLRSRGEHVGVHFPMSFYKKRPWYEVNGDVEWLYYLNNDDFVRAVCAARSARFTSGRRTR